MIDKAEYNIKAAARNELVRRVRAEHKKVGGNLLEMISAELDKHPELLLAHEVKRRTVIQQMKERNARYGSR